MSTQTSKDPRMPERPRNARQQTLLRMPERFKDGEDAQEDVTAPKTKNAMYMNQSFMSMIANVGSTSKSRPEGAPGEPSLTSHLEDIQGEESDDGIQNNSTVAGFRISKPLLRETNHLMSQSLPGLRRPAPRNLARTLMAENMSSSQILTRPKPGQEPIPISIPEDTDEHESEGDGEDDAHDTQHEKEEEEEQGTGMEDLVEEDCLEKSQEEDAETDLAEKLAHMFAFPEVEEVIAEYPCWLFQNVLLQGYLYITNRHICFYSYLPQKSNNATKSGFVFKRGRQNPKYRRWWFTLKGDTFSYYTDPSNLYFPSGSIDLRSGATVELAQPQGKEKEETGFNVVTEQRTYLLRAESAASAKEWVKAIQKVIFRTQNEGDSVKISLPVSNILDIEENPVMDFAETFKIRIFDNDETYAIDEYFFSFFDPITDALSILRGVVENNAMHKVNKSIFQDKRPVDKQAVEKSGDAASDLLREETRTVASDSPHGGEDMLSSSPRSAESLLGLASGDGRKNAAQRLLENRQVVRSRPQSIYEDNSMAQSSEDNSRVVSSRQSFEGLAITASQILQRSDVFDKPTIRHKKGTSLDMLRKPRPESVRMMEMEAPSLTATEADLSEALAMASSMKLGSLSPEAVKTSRPLSGGDRPASVRQSSSTSTLQDLVRAGAYPIQKATGLAGLLKMQSRRVGSLLANESKGYYGKVMSMWAGERMHYDESEGRISNDDMNEDKEDEERGNEYGERFRGHFTLPDSEKLQATYHGYLHRMVPIYGKVYIGDTKLCFRSLVPGFRTKMILPIRDIENINQEKGFRFGYSGLVVVIHGHEELFFEFSKPDARDDCAVTLLRALDSRKHLQDPLSRSPEQESKFQTEKAESQGLERARKASLGSIELSRRGSVDLEASEEIQIVFDDPSASIIDFKPSKSLKVTCLTIGSRGDVQPYIALCKGLIEEGHQPKIATHAEFEPWIRSHGIDFVAVAGDPAEIMRLCVENDMFTVNFFREATSKFRGWIDELLESSWHACQGSDLLIESPSAMGGIHIAEALQIPYFRAFTMPWTQTRSYPHAFAVPSQKMGGNYNAFSYVLFESVFWQATAGQINRWRKRTLDLPSTSLDKLQMNKVPFLYNFSPSVVVQPLDFPHWIRITGYWFLDEASTYTPPPELTEFIRRARADGKKLVYVGFGSIVVDDSAALTRTIVQSVLKADVRCILSKGWSDRLSAKDTSHAAAPEAPLPPEIHTIKSAPHDWLFRQMDAAAHHGGAGTTGASLRAGIPTLIKPFFGDQFFFGQRVEDLGVGKCLKLLNTSVLARALWEVTNSERMIVKARELGRAIRAENGVGTAIQTIYRDMEYANSLIKRMPQAQVRKNAVSSTPAATEVYPDPEDSWTLIEDDDNDDGA